MFVGIFFDEFVVGTLPITSQQGGLHVTLAFRPNAEQMAALTPYMGKKVPVKIVGYGNNGRNEGLAVDIGDIPYFGAKTQHITLSRISEAKPVETGFIDFSSEKLDKFRETHDFPNVVYGIIKEI